MIDKQTWLSIPLRIRFEGWVSDTYKLQQAGWQLSARENPNSYSLQLALRHQELGIYMLSNRVDVDYFAAAHMPGGVSTALRHMELSIRHVGQANTIKILHTSETNLFEFKPIDAMPQLVEHNIGDLQIFAPIQVRTQEVVVMPDSVPDLLEHILKLQAPDQARIREDARRRAARANLPEELARPRQHIHAQIITLDKERR